MALFNRFKAKDRTQEQEQLEAGLELLFDYEKQLAERLIAGLKSIPGVRVLGISDPKASDRRVPTVSFVHEQHAPAEIARQLAARNIFVWSGHNYALELAKVLNINDSGGAVRIGAVHYNTAEEIEAVVAALQEILAS